MKVIIAGGGTGGHLFPAVAVGEELMRERRDTAVLFAGTSAGIEAKWLPKSGYDYELFTMHGIRGHGPVARVRATLEFVRATSLAIAMVRRFKPDLVVSAGGYASASTAAAAILTRVPIVLMEQNTRPGLVNRVIARFARKICVGFDDGAPFFDRAKTVVTGNPVRFEYRPRRVREAGAPPQILVLGGSSGAHRLNLGVVGALKILGKGVIKSSVAHQTGAADEELVRKAYRDISIAAEVVPFIGEIAAALNRADLVIARSGAMTVTDLALAARASILVPYPFHKDMQQFHNARVLERIGGAIIVTDDDRLAPNLSRELSALMDDPEKIAAMGERAHQAAMPDAARDIARICFAVAGEAAA